MRTCPGKVRPFHHLKWTVADNVFPCLQDSNIFMAQAGVLVSMNHLENKHQEINGH